MSGELISENRYSTMSRRTYWKNSVKKYQEEQSLEDIFMDEKEFIRLEYIVTSQKNVLSAVQDLAKHGMISVPSKLDMRKSYFNARDTLTLSGILTNSRAPRLSDKGRAFLLEYGRRIYDSVEV
jgi:hypothetical protein